MKYRSDRNGVQISQLGYGCMRFSKKGNSINYEKAEKEVLLAIKNGVNYFDTAYVYPGSEECLGRILDENKCRDKVYIATKLPQYIIRSSAAIDKTFNEELVRLRTEYIDYYLMHMFTDYAEWEHLKELGIEEWIAAQKAAGRIRNIGFSYHGETEMFLKILDAYDWDFCQIQYNYLDEHTQAGRRGLQAAAGKGIPVIIQVKQIIREREKVSCTGCRYCMPCPHGVDIPGNFYYYNLMYMEKKSSARFEFAQNMGLRREPGFASQCIGCGKCEKHCPQHIPIREKLKEADSALRPLPYKAGIYAARKIIVK